MRPKAYYYFSDFNPVFPWRLYMRCADKKGRQKLCACIHTCAFDGRERERERDIVRPLRADNVYTCVCISPVLVVIPPLGSLFWNAMLSEHYSDRETKDDHVTNSPYSRASLAVILHRAWNANIPGKNHMQTALFEITYEYDREGLWKCPG